MEWLVSLTIGTILGIIMGYMIHSNTLFRRVLQLDALQRKKLRSWLDAIDKQKKEEE